MYSHPAGVGGEVPGYRVTHPLVHCTCGEAEVGRRRASVYEPKDPPLSTRSVTITHQCLLTVAQKTAYIQWYIWTFKQLYLPFSNYKGYMHHTVQLRSNTHCTLYQGAAYTTLPLTRDAQ